MLNEKKGKEKKKERAKWQPGSSPRKLALQPGPINNLPTQAQTWILDYLWESEAGVIFSQTNHHFYKLSQEYKNKEINQIKQKLCKDYPEFAKKLIAKKIDMTPEKWLAWQETIEQFKTAQTFLALTRLTTPGDEPVLGMTVLLKNAEPFKLSPIIRNDLTTRVRLVKEKTMKDDHGLDEWQAWIKDLEAGKDPESPCEPAIGYSSPPFYQRKLEQIQKMRTDSISEEIVLPPIFNKMPEVERDRLMSSLKQITDPLAREREIGKRERTLALAARQEQKRKQKERTPAGKFLRKTKRSLDLVGDVERTATIAPPLNAKQIVQTSVAETFLNLPPEDLDFYKTCLNTTGWANQEVNVERFEALQAQINSPEARAARYITAPLKLPQFVGELLKNTARAKIKPSENTELNVKITSPAWKALRTSVLGTIKALNVPFELLGNISEVAVEGTINTFKKSDNNNLDESSSDEELSEEDQQELVGLVDQLEKQWMWLQGQADYLKKKWESLEKKVEKQKNILTDPTSLSEAKLQQAEAVMKRLITRLEKIAAKVMELDEQQTEISQLMRLRITNPSQFYSKILERHYEAEQQANIDLDVEALTSLSIEEATQQLEKIRKRSSNTCSVGSESSSRALDDSIKPLQSKPLATVVQYLDLNRSSELSGELSWSSETSGSSSRSRLNTSTHRCSESSVSTSSSLQKERKKMENRLQPTATEKGQLGSSLSSSSSLQKEREMMENMLHQKRTNSDSVTDRADTKTSSKIRRLPTALDLNQVAKKLETLPATPRQPHDSTLQVIERLKEQRLVELVAHKNEVSQTPSVDTPLSTPRKKHIKEEKKPQEAQEIESSLGGHRRRGATAPEYPSPPFEQLPVRPASSPPSSRSGAVSRQSSYRNLFNGLTRTHSNRELPTKPEGASPRGELHRAGSFRNFFTGSQPASSQATPRGSFELRGARDSLELAPPQKVTSPRDSLELPRNTKTTLRKKLKMRG